VAANDGTFGIIGDGVGDPFAITDPSIRCRAEVMAEKGQGQPPISPAPDRFGLTSALKTK
jgi:hypothetical protein